MKRIQSHLSIILIVLGLSSCHFRSTEVKSEEREQHYISGRDEGQGRQPVYSVKMPISWIRHDPLPNDQLQDTTKALCEFIIMDDSEILRITIHNFPTTQISERIPPQAQVARWERQFDYLDRMNSTIIPQSYSGYSGLLFSGEGKMHEKDISMMAWSLQVAPEHYRNLSQMDFAPTKFLYNQMRSDVTIKAVGTNLIMQKHRKAIIDFARSFELIKEIPARS